MVNELTITDFAMLTDAIEAESRTAQHKAARDGR
jgi:hypothetical protein